jgi:hypothetical protein
MSWRSVRRVEERGGDESGGKLSRGKQRGRI